MACRFFPFTASMLPGGERKRERVRRVGFVCTRSSKRRGIYRAWKVRVLESLLEKDDRRGETERACLNYGRWLSGGSKFPLTPTVEFDTCIFLTLKKKKIRNALSLHHSL